MQKYSVNQHLIENVLSWVSTGEIAIPEIQRPFVWDSSKVRFLVVGLYQDYQTKVSRVYEFYYCYDSLKEKIIKGLIIKGLLSKSIVEGAVQWEC